jgi:heme exporter protein D
MIWNSWHDFWSMGGRGAFVWGSYGVVAVAVVAEILAVRARLARARRDAARPRGRGAPPR